MYKYDKIYTCSIDIVSSTQIINEQGNNFRDIFYSSLTAALIPYLDKYELQDSIVKFTGDGFLISIISPSKLINLICFGLVLKTTYGQKLNEVMQLSVGINWRIRIGISSGNDILIDIFGRKDVIGDSVRKAVRTSSICLDNELLVSREIFDETFRDFEFEIVKLEERINALNKNKKIETDVQSFYSIIRLKMPSTRKDYVSKYLASRDLHDFETSDKIIKSSIEDVDFIESNTNNGLLDLLTIAKANEDKVNLQLLERIRIERGIEKNIYFYNKLINRISSLDNIGKILAEMKEAKIPPNLITLTTILNKVDRVVDFDQVFKQIKEANVTPDVFIYNILINKVENFEKAKEVFNNMKRSGISPDNISFNTLMNKVNNYAEAEQLLIEMNEAEILPDRYTYNTILSKIDNYNDAKKIIDDMKKSSIQPDDYSFNILINKITNNKDINNVLNDMQQSGLQPDKITFTTLIKKADSLENALLVMEQMSLDNIEIDIYTFNLLLKKAPDLKNAKQLLKTIKKRKVEMNNYTLNILLNKSANLAESWEVIHEMVEFGISPDKVSYNTLITKAANLDEAYHIFNTMKASGFKPDMITFNTLLNKSVDFDSAKRVHQEMIEAEFAPDDVTFSTLFSKEIKHENVNDILNWYLKQNYHPRDSIGPLINQLYAKEKYEDCFRVILNYPDLKISNKIYKLIGEESIDFLLALKNELYYSNNIHYAKGIYYYATHQYQESKKELKIALKLAITDRRRKSIKELINKIEYA